MNDKGNAFFVSGNDTPKDLGGGVRRQVMVHDDMIMMVKVWFEQGAIGYVHNHPHRQVTFVASGVFEVTIDGVKNVLKKGDSFYVAPDLRHGVLCVETGVLVDVFEPARQDFLGED